MRRTARGMTLIEILVVIAIIGIIVAAMLVALFPSDDRRVKGEAERLAAYLEAASAQAKMNEGPVRVELAFETGEYHRESAKVGAQLGERNWATDASAKAERVRAPVKLAAVLMGGAGEVSSGTGWFLWEDTRTAGGVAVLELNEAVWSVIVDPTTGEVKSERGRAAMPGSAAPLRRKLGQDVTAALGGEGAAFETMPAGGLLGKGLSDLPGQRGAGDGVESGSQPSDTAPSPDPTEAPPTGGTPPPTPPPSIDNPAFDAGAPEDAAPEPDVAAEDAQVPDALLPDAEVIQCSTDSDCPPVAGFNQVCVLAESAPSNRCHVDPRGRTFKVRKFTLGGALADTPFADAFDDQLAALFDADTYRLFVRIDPEGRGNANPGPSAAYTAWIVQDAAASGAGEGGLRQFTMMNNSGEGVGTRSTRARARIPNGVDASGEKFSIEFMPVDRSRQGWGPRYIELFPLVETCYYRFSALLGGFIDVQAGNGEIVHTLRVASCFEDKELRKYRISLPDGRRLDALTVMSELVPNPDCDTNDDGDLDGRTLALDGALIEVGLDGDPTRYTSTVPYPICSDTQ